MRMNTVFFACESMKEHSLMHHVIESGLDQMVISNFWQAAKRDLVSFHFGQPTDHHR